MVHDPHHVPSATNGEATPADEPADPRAAVMLPAQLLQPGEIIILLIKPSAWSIILEAAGSIVALAALIVIAMVIDSFGFTSVGRHDLLLLGVGLIGLRLFWQFLEWLSRVYVLTDRRVIRVEGVIRINIFEAPLKQVQHTNLLITARERLFGLGTISFSTAGTAHPDAYWRMVARPLDVHQAVIQTLQRYR